MSVLFGQLDLALQVQEMGPYRAASALRLAGKACALPTWVVLALKRYLQVLVSRRMLSRGHAVQEMGPHRACTALRLVGDRMWFGDVGGRVRVWGSDSRQSMVRIPCESCRRNVASGSALAQCTAQVRLARL